MGTTVPMHRGGAKERRSDLQKNKGVGEGGGGMSKAGHACGGVKGSRRKRFQR